MGVAERERVVVNAPGELGRYVCAGLVLIGILPDRTSEPEGIDNRLQSVACAARGKRKGVLVVLEKRTRYVRLQLEPPLRRPMQSETIAGVQLEVPQSKGNRPVGRGRP